ncbi:hypothetical protein [Duganella callida]|uniref:Peptidase M4 n=1 Tax=Duganella callida TaxID=2561932 RepID=A0A4Y9SHW5_9BURK|nr:hypothetical protein [Duganella callida]TFW20089.1 hypothetical protein E4L98_15275 [Duganella callida]
MTRFNTRKMTMLVQDPHVRIAGRLVFEQVELAYEDLAPGPVGYRVKVADFDASAEVLYSPFQPPPDTAGVPRDRYAYSGADNDARARKAWENSLLADPAFHAQNVYAIVMRTLGIFEFALGRRVAWGFEGHQLHVAPHAFMEANAFYSERDKALFFGYFDSHKTRRRVFTCLSHDIVAHETTHALLDGVRDSYSTPSTPDQAAFHEGFADVVALLSVFSLPKAVELALTGGRPVRTDNRIRLIPAARVGQDAILDSMLLGLGKEFGASMDEEGARADCLRRSARIAPDPGLLQSDAYQDAHARGELFAAAMLRGFVAMWCGRIAALGTFPRRSYNLDMVIDEGARAASHLLTMAIRALDYCPPVDLTFSAYLAGLLTADAEVAPDDTRYAYRQLLKDSFAGYGIRPPSRGTDAASGCWLPFSQDAAIVYQRNHADSMLYDKEEVFRFIWENRRVLRIDERGYLRVRSVQPSVRQGPDGFFLRETICEYVQVFEIFGAEARSSIGIERPAGMPPTQPITAYGGGIIVLDQFGRIKYHIEHRLDDAERQSARLDYLWRSGQLGTAPDARNQFADIHRKRAMM